MPAWTEQQMEAITASGCNVLVAAGAGSGKTAVLVERIIRQVTGPQPVDIDRLLVVTFTEAAARQMRERIASALEAALEKNPGHIALRRQLAYWGKAHICTLHSFCLDIVQRFFHQLGLDPAPRVLDENEAALLRQEVLEQVLAQRFADPGEGFVDLVGRFGGTGLGEQLERTVLDVYKSSLSHPWPQDWLIQAARAFDLPPAARMEETRWAKCALAEMTLTLADAAHQLQMALWEAANGPVSYRHQLRAEVDMVMAASRAIEKATWEEARRICRGLAFNDLPRMRSGEVDEEIKRRVQKLRTKAKQQIKKLLVQYCTRPSAELMNDIRALAPAMRTLADLTGEFAKRYAGAKREQAAVDFSDLEHLCLQLLLAADSSPGQPRPSPVARQLRDQYLQVLVDEYQDINPVQDLILQLVSRQDDKTPNLFMVGDVKQSIYRFRLAQPALFLEKQMRYPKAPGGQEQAIWLATNFRSRPAVLEGVNHVFRHLCTPQVAELAYGHDEELRPGADYPPDDRAVELVMLERGGTDEEEELSAVEREARFVAHRIATMVARGEPIWDQGAYRPVRYRDIVILLRAGGRAQDFLEALRQYDVPAYTELGKSYFAASEVEVVLSLLQVIDNPHQDIPLAAVLRSPIVGCTTGELAAIRCCDRQGDFWQAVQRAAADEGIDEALRAKLTKFRHDLSQWRTAARQGPLGDLLWQIYHETGYLQFVGALPGGSQRQANLRALLERASRFDRFPRQGLYRFLRFIERLREDEDDLGAAQALGEHDDVVRVMSIHKSKGLEFPVVIIAELGRPFTRTDEQGDLLLHRDLGFGPRCVDTVTRTKFPSLAHHAVRFLSWRENLAEEMRVLYVGMTRAKERLLLVGSLRDLDQRRQSWRSDQSGPLPAALLAQANCHLDWLGMAVSQHPEGRWLTEPGAARLPGCQWQITLWPRHKSIPAPPTTKENHLPWEILRSLQAWPEADQAAMAEIDRRLRWSYQHAAATTLPAKVTASELERLAPDQEAEPLAPAPRWRARRPRFLPAKTALTPTERGTATHLVLQHLDLAGDLTEAGIIAQIETLKRRQLLGPVEAAAVDAAALAAFFRSELGLRILAHRATVRREVPFLLGLSAAEVFGHPGEEIVVVQGMIDLLFLSAGQPVVVDFKTDQITPEMVPEAARRYQRQLRIYGQAAAAVYGRPTAGLYLVFLATGETARVG
ncbi:MAG TPA: helicase-exonuclease AddAB subunit AddA [Firmicutes bacterium]|jgi:ATP-dependent helicase/nuclease subunit A|nr:helicase-exonuclease AddAB subunit AddA [Bacillota bacterium]